MIITIISLNKLNWHVTFSLNKLNWYAPISLNKLKLARDYLIK
jgi:hypothetical protein